MNLYRRYFTKLYRSDHWEDPARINAYCWFRLEELVGKNGVETVDQAIKIHKEISEKLDRIAVILGMEPQDGPEALGPFE